MDIKDKTKEELIIELQELKQENSELKALIENRTAKLIAANEDLFLQNEDITDVSLLLQKAEKLLEIGQSDPNKNFSEAELLKLIHELEVHQIELELQNEELLLAKEQEERAREKYTSIFDFAPSAYFTLNDSSNIVELNLAGAQMLGEERQKLINSKLSLYMSSSSRVVFDNFLLQVISRSSPASCEVTFGTEEDSCINALLKGTLSDDGKQCRITAVDITERNKRELELRKTAELNYLLVALFANAPALTDNQLYDEALDIAVKITGSAIGFFHQVSDDQQEIILTTWNDEAKKNCTTVYDNHYPMDKAGNWADCVRQKKPVVYNDYSASPNRKGLPQGHSSVGRMMSVPVIDDNKVRLIFGVGNKSSDYTDSDVLQIQAIANEMYKILEKRKVEHILHKIEDRWQFAIEGSSDGIWDWNVLTGDVFFSNRFKEMIGFFPNELEGKLSEWQSRVHPDDIEAVMFRLHQHFNKETSDYAGDYRLKCKDGSWKWILARGKVLEWTIEGKPFRMVGTHTDITWRKQAEELMRRKEYDLRESQRIAHVGSWRLDLATNEVFWTEELYNMYGFDPSIPPPPYTEHMKLFTPESWERLSTAFERTRDTGIPYTLELETVKKDGSNGWMWVRGEADVDSTGKIVALWGAAQDITGRKIAENEIRWRNEDLQLLNTINHAANRNETLDSILNIIGEQFGKTFNSYLLSIHLPNNETGEFIMHSNTLGNDIVQKIKKLTGRELPQIRMKINDEHPFSEIERNGKGLLLTDKQAIVTRFEGYLKGTNWPSVVQSMIKKVLPALRSLLEYQSVVVVPMIANGKTIGFLELGSRSIMAVHDLNRIQSIADHFAAVIVRQESEKKLREREFQYRNLANAGSALIWTSGTDNLLNYVNDIWLRYTGRTLEQEMGKGWTEGIHPDDFDKCIETCNSAFDKRVPFEMEYRLRHSSGEYRWIVDLGTPNYNSTGEFIGFIGHCFDISERKSTELALSQSEEKYRSIFESVQEVYFEASIDGTLLEVSPSIEKITNGQFTRNEMIGQSFAGIYANAGDRDLYFSKLLEQKRVNDYELMLRNKDGSTIPVAISSVISFDTSGIPVKITGILRDKTERKIAENALKQTLEQLNYANQHLEKRVKERTREILELSGLQKAILANAPLTIMTINKEGIYQSINPSGEKMLGYSADEIIGKLNPFAFHDRDELLKIFFENSDISNPTDEDIYHTILQYIYHKTTEWTWIRKNGEKFPVRLTHSSIIDDNGVLNGYMGIITDITQEKLALKSLRESEKRFHSMFYDHSAIMLLIEPETGEIIEANKAAEQFYGLPFNSTPKFLISDLNTIDSYALKQEMALALLQRRNYFVFKHKLASGNIKIVEVHTTPIEVGGKKVLFSIIHDITDRRLAENALKKSEAENRAIIQAVPDLMFRIQRDGTYLDSHSQNESSLYVPKEYFVGKKVSDVLPPDLALKSMNAIEEAFTRGEVVQYEYMLPIQEKDRYFENRMIAISDMDVLSIIRDITDRKIAETELQEALRKLSTLIQNLRAGTLFENESRKITLVNQSFCNIFNIQATPEQLEGYDCVLASEESKQIMKDPEGFTRQIDKILSKGEIVVNDELYLLDGRVLERDYIPIKNNNTLMGHLWQYRDITNRKTSETALKMQSAALDSFALSIIITDVAGYIQWVNSAFTKLTGYSLDEAVGKTCGELVKSGKQGKEFFIGFWETLLNKEVWSGELINRKKDGSLYYEEQTITPVIDSQGNISSFIAVKIDITERKALYSELANEKRRLADIIKGTNVGTWEWNVQTGETIFNEYWAEMLGYSLEEISPVSIETWMKFAHPDDLNTSGELLNKHFNGELDFYSCESRMKHKNGEWIWVLDRGRVHEWDTDGKPLLMSGTHQDISEQKRIESALQQAKNEAEKANLAKSEFLSRMSHELRTPMNSIIGFAQLMEMGELNPKQKKGVTHILNNGKHLLDLINEVLNIAGIEAGKHKMFTEPLQLANAINEIIDSIHIVAYKRKISIEFADSPANNLFVLADKLRLKQVLINLLSNAVKYNKEGGSITIQTKLQPVNEQGNALVRISITDTGIGITHEDAGKLFQPFERIDAVKTEVEGTGLGLMIVKKITEAMGGTVGVESEAGVGSTFWIELPQAENRKDEAVQSIGTTSPALQVTNTSSTILYIEDNRSNIELIEEVFAEHRPEILLVTSKFGKKTIELAKKHKPGLILLDLDLPDINGKEVLVQLLDDEHTKSIPVIIISADAMPFQIDKLMKAGAAAYLTKPLDLVLFLKTIEQHTII